MGPRRARAVATLLSLTLTAILAPAGPPGPLRGAASASAADEIDHRAPSEAPIIDRFRPPDRPWGPGNRGIDFGTEPGAVIRASAAGRVVFAGEVGGALHVTVEHGDGLRTTCSFLASLSVVRGDRVLGGDQLGIAAGPFHFGVRAPDDTYLDPELLLAGRIRPRTTLVPGADEGRPPLDSRERRTLLTTLRDTGSAAIAHLARTGGRAAGLMADAMSSAGSAAVVARVAVATARWFDQRDRCTPRSVATPRAADRRIAIEVSGLGTASPSNSAWEFDTDAIGYADDDVIRFSYRGGRAPSAGGDGSADVDTVMMGERVRSFTSIDSQQSIGTSADHLAELIDATARANPGVPIDVLAHSQGGVVARLAITRAAGRAELPESVSTLVTVGSPHGGAPLATGAEAMRLSPTGRMVLAEIRASGIVGPLDDRLPATRDLASTSELLGEMHARPMPEQVRFVSIGASGDLIVPGVATSDPSADDQRILPTPVGTRVHGELTSDPRTTREIALSVSGLALTCQTLSEAVGAFFTAQTIAVVESATTLSAAGVLAAAPIGAVGIDGD